MKVLVIGGGGREHVLAWKLAQSPQVTQVYAAPGNPGMAQVGECISIPAENIDELVAFARAEQIDWTVVGPEAPLCAGMVDRFQAEGLKVFGPSQAAAQLEGSKIFSKQFMQEFGIPTAAFGVCESAEQVRSYLQDHPLPQVIKADGLAAGKGVFVCHTDADVDTAIDEIFIKQSFGEAGKQVLIEECLEGVEASFLVFSDGKNVLPLEPAQDHKPIFEGNKGPNTGGMGTFSPTETLPPELRAKILRKIVQPSINGMIARGTPFKGILYTGLMLTSAGPKVLEFNVRFGDPEAQVILPRLKSDLIDVFAATERQALDSMSLDWDERQALCVVLASEGYPGSYPKGLPISGLESIDQQDTIVFHAGTKQDHSDIVTSGGRVLGVTALGKNRAEAKSKAYGAVAKISWDGMYYRKDIGDN